MIPSFAIMGIHPETTLIAQKIQEYARRLELSKDLDQLILNIENVCLQACIELELELKNLNK
jgi:hypothetical protein